VNAFFNAVVGALAIRFTPGGGAAAGWPLTLDFENGSYTDATTTYALADVWEVDTDWGNGGSLDKVANGTGLVAGPGLDQQWFHFADAFSDLVAAGPIVVLDFSIADAVLNDGAGAVVFGYEMGDWTEAELDILNEAGGSFIKANDGTEAPLPAVFNGDHKLAVLFTNGRIAASLDGGDVVAMDNPGPNTFTRIGVALKSSNGTVTLRSGVFRDPAEGESALPTLSSL